jgi:ferritin
MDKKLEKAFNDQIKNEFYSAYLYLSMAAFAESKSLSGAANWFKKQYAEEISHGMKMFEFLHDRGAKVTLQAIPQPETEFASLHAAFNETLKHEKKVTALIEALVDLARKVDDKAAEVFLHWFISEQVEEEKNATKIIDDLRLVKPDSAALLMLDKQLGKRE